MATITGTAAGESLTGTRLQDEIFGLGGDDRIYGRAGNDTIDGGTGRDFLAGRAGSDFYYVDTGFDRVAERLNEGESDIVFATVSFRLRENVENLELRGAASRGYGNDLANRLTVEAGQIVDNVLNGRGGADLMAGGRGNDIYYVDNASDIIEEVGSDVDTVRSSVSFVLVGDSEPTESIGYVENLVLLGTYDIDGSGNSQDNRITGNEGANFLNGRGGQDLLEGRRGNDVYYISDTEQDVGPGGQGLDKVVESVDGGLDTIRLEVSSVIFVLPDNVENLIFISSDAAAGNRLDNTIIGDRSSDYINGDRGDDRIFGKAGNDRLDGFIGNDLLEGGNGDDELSGSDGDDRLSGGRGIDTLYLGPGADSVYFDVVPTLYNSDRIDGFMAGVDKFYLDRDVFISIGEIGTLSAEAFYGNGQQPYDESTRIIYNKDLDRLYYDADGSGPEEAIMLAVMLNNDGLSHSDFVIYNG